MIIFYLLSTYFILEILNLIYYLKIKRDILKKTYYYGNRIEKSIISDFFKRNLNEFFNYYLKSGVKKKEKVENINLIFMIRLLLSYFFNKSLSQANFYNLKIVYHSVCHIKNKLKIKINNEHDQESNNIFMRFGKNSFNSYYKPLFLTYFLIFLRIICELIMRFNGFKSYYSSKTNINYWYKLNSKKKNLNPLMFIHGFGVGIIPYISYLIKLSKETTVICPVLPNISNVYFHPLKWNVSKNDFFPDFKLIFQEISDIFEQHKISKVNIIAHSFGTFLLSGLVLDPSIRKKINKKIYIDPVCFHTERYKIYKSVDFVKGLKKGGILKKIREYLIYYFIYLDIYLKYVTKRNLFSMDYLWGNYRYIDNNSLVVLSELDEITPSKGINDELSKLSKSKNILWINNASHGDLFLDSKFKSILDNKIQDFINK